MERTNIKDWFQLPDISHSLPFYRIIQVGTGLRRCLVQPPAENRVSYEMRKNYSMCYVCVEEHVFITSVVFARGAKTSRVFACLPTHAHTVQECKDRSGSLLSL